MVKKKTLRENCGSTKADGHIYEEAPLRCGTIYLEKPTEPDEIRNLNLPVIIDKKRKALSSKE